jgi:DNA-binding LacI/PurR family transcriptional regulator
LGLVAGQDVALVGFNGTEGIDRAPCPISTVRQPIDAMCALTLEFLRAQIEDRTTPIQQTILKPELIIRESSGLTIND